MKLADVMGASGLSGFAIVALLLFVAAFLMVLAMILAPGSTERMTRASQLPLEDDADTRNGSADHNG